MVLFDIKNPERYLKAQTNRFIKRRINARDTEKVFNAIADLDCIKGYTLIGGTALAIQTGKAKISTSVTGWWHKNKDNSRLEVDWNKIEDELKAI
ncbi:MAG: hypothetical protein LBG19_02895 [Prevotellaceae bacterium]|nr:hypothetical protein [Prevotellaceae bacterium]